jgi:hypothetical protein
VTVAWTSDLMAALSAGTVTPILVLESIDDAPGVGGSWRLSTHDVEGTPGWISAWEVSPPEVRAREWVSTIGSFSVTIASIAWRNLANRIVRGQFVRLRIGLPGWPVSRFEALTWGQVWNVTGNDVTRTIDCRDAWSALRQRPTTTSSALSLFWDVDDGTTDATTVATANYVAGAATVQVASTTGSARDSSAAGIIRVSPNSGADFFLKYTGKTGVAFTGCSATGQLGTTAANADIGKAVAFGVLLVGHPIESFTAIVTSTGTAAANGPGDTLPESWGYGIPCSLLDVEDAPYWTALAQPSSGADDWDVATFSSAADGAAWWEEVVAPGGYFVTMRMGLLTQRCAVDPNTTTTNVHAEIVEDDIVQIESVELWSEDYDVEYDRVVVTASGVSTFSSEAIGSLPAQRAITYACAGVVFSNGAAIADEILARVGPWALRVPERIVLRTRGWYHAQLTPGDVITFTCSWISGRLTSTKGGYDRRRAWVASAGIEQGHTTRIVLLVLPTDADALGDT